MSDRPTRRDLPEIAMLVERIEKMVEAGRSPAEILRVLRAEGNHSDAEVRTALKEAQSVEIDLDELEDLLEEEDVRDAQDQRQPSIEEQRRGD